MYLFYAPDTYKNNENKNLLIKLAQIQKYKVKLHPRFEIYQNESRSEMKPNECVGR